MSSYSTIATYYSDVGPVVLGNVDFLVLLGDVFVQKGVTSADTARQNGQWFVRSAMRRYPRFVRAPRDEALARYHMGLAICMVQRWLQRCTAAMFGCTGGSPPPLTPNPLQSLRGRQIEGDAAASPSRGHQCWAGVLNHFICAKP